MGHPRRMFLNNRAYFITNRVAKGLPFVACLYINLLLLGILARAKFLHPSITICAWLFLGSHYHGIIVTNGDADSIRKFMNYLDGELAKSVKRWMGIQYNVKIWAQRYHAALLLTPQDVINELVYIFTNPVAANLVAKAQDWFGFTTFDPAFQNKHFQAKWVRPSKIEALPNKDLSRSLVKSLVRSISELKAHTLTLTVEPLAWMRCFAEEHHLSKAQVIEELLEGIENAEQKAALLRAQEGQRVASREKIEFQNPHKKFISKNHGIRVFCISRCPKLRQEYIALYKDFCEKCSRVWKRWKEGFLSDSYPPGAFPPPRSLLANILPAPI